MKKNLAREISEEVEERGFSRVVKVFSLREIEIINSELHEFIQSEKAADDWFSAVDAKGHKNIAVETIYDAHLKRGDISSIIKNKNIVHVAESILGGKADVWRTTFWIKPHGARRVEWHQDTFKSEGFGSFPNVNFWLAFDYAELDNCLWFVEKTHFEIIDTSVFRKESYVKELEESPALPQPPIDGGVSKLALKPGEGVFFDGRCLHGSPPNNSKHRRAGLVIRFIPKGYQLRRCVE